MKRLLLFSMLAGLCSMFAIAQQNLRKLNTGGGISFPNPSKPINQLLAEVNKLDDLPKIHVNPEQIPTLKKKLFPPDYRLKDNMPILRPKGYFHGIIVKPDSAIDFKLIIKKPY